MAESARRRGLSNNRLQGLSVTARLGRVEALMSFGFTRLLRRFLVLYGTEVAQSELAEKADAPLDPVDSIITLGEVAGWWEEELNTDLLFTIIRLWREAMDVNGVVASSLESGALYTAGVKDRLVRGISPTLPEEAFNTVRKTMAQRATLGWTPDEFAERIAVELKWDLDRPYWQGVKAQADAKIDALLDEVGPPRSAARHQARLTDPTVQAWRNQRNEAIKNLDRGKTRWQTRAERIARTESTGLYNAAAQQALIEEGQVAKKWIAAHDERTRPTHAEADGEIVGVFEDFVVGNSSLKFPGDPSGEAGEVINCRCTIVGVSQAEWDETRRRLSLVAAAENTETFYSPGQPRRPAGVPGGGQFTEAGGGVLNAWLGTPQTKHPSAETLDAMKAEFKEAVDPALAQHGLTVVLSAGGTMKHLTFMGSLVTASGRPVGQFERTLSHAEKQVTNAQFGIDKAYQNRGIGTDLTEAMEAHWAASGFTSVRVYANADVGGYAWATAGFDWLDREGTGGGGIAPGSTVPLRMLRRVAEAHSTTLPKVGALGFLARTGVPERASSRLDTLVPVTNALIDLKSNDPKVTSMIERARNLIRTQNEVGGDAARFRFYKDVNAMELHAEADPDMAQVISWRKSLEAGDADRFPTPYELSRVGRKEGSQVWAGKEALIGAHWDGIKKIGPGTVTASAQVTDTFYSPSQPRHPAGTSSGGRFAKGGGGVSSLTSYLSSRPADGLEEVQDAALDLQEQRFSGTLNVAENGVWLDYITDSHVRLNRVLRTGTTGDNDPEFDVDMRDRARTLDSMFESTGYRFSKDVTLYRGINSSYDPATGSSFWVDQIKVGEVVEDKGFMSTSVSPDFFRRYSEQGGYFEGDDMGSPWEMVIQAPKGTRFLPGPASQPDMASENEAILRPGTAVQIIGRDASAQKLYGRVVVQGAGVQDSVTAAAGQVETFYSPSQPRVPKGSGDSSGEFAPKGGGGGGGAVGTGTVPSEVSGQFTEMSPASADQAMADANVLGLEEGISGNCQLAVAAYEMRRRGFDTYAKIMPPSGPHPLDGGVFDYFEAPDGSFLSSATKRAKDPFLDGRVAQSAEGIRRGIEKDLSVMPEGSRGALFWYPRTGNEGHIVAWERSGGAVRLLDPQSGAEVTDGSLSWVHEYGTVRLDNANATPKISRALADDFSVDWVTAKREELIEAEDDPSISQTQFEARERKVEYALRGVTYDVEEFAR